MRTGGRTTIYKSIRMRSRLEASFAQLLDAHGDEWEYEPLCFADEMGQYLPDFRLPTRYEDGHLYIEVKPNPLTDVATVFRRMHIIRSTEENARLSLMTGRWVKNNEFLPAQHVFDCAAACWDGCWVCKPDEGYLPQEDWRPAR